LTAVETGSDFANANNSSYVGAMNFWLRLPNVTSVTGMNTILDVGEYQVTVDLANGTGADVGKLYVEITVLGTDGSPAFQSRTSAHTQADGWLHIQASWNTSWQQTSCLYVNDVSDNNLLAPLGTHPCEYMATSPAQISLGSDARTTMPGQYGASFDICEFWFSESVYLDFTNPAVRGRFEASGGHPANLGPNGSFPAGTPPILYFRSPSSSFGTNSGSGGNFTFYGSGALTVSSSAP
jgi:hypothetical protein